MLRSGNKEKLLIAAGRNVYKGEYSGDEFYRSSGNR